MLSNGEILLWSFVGGALGLVPLMLALGYGPRTATFAALRALAVNVLAWPFRAWLLGRGVKLNTHRQPRR
jgi:hypothetical protein